MSETYSLLEFLRQLASDGPLRAEYLADPRGTLVEHSLAGLSPEDVRDALVLADEARTVDYDPDHVSSPSPDLGGDTVDLFDAYVSEHDLGGDPDYGTADFDDLDPAGFGAGEAVAGQHHDLTEVDGFATDFGSSVSDPLHDASASYPDPMDRDDLADLVADLDHDPGHDGFPHAIDPPDPS